MFVCHSNKLKIFEKIITHIFDKLKFDNSLIYLDLWP